MLVYPIALTTLIDNLRFPVFQNYPIWHLYYIFIISIWFDKYNKIVNFISLLIITFT